MDLIAAKLASKKSLERAQATLLATQALLEYANANGKMSMLAKYQKQALRQRDAVAACQAVYDELNAANDPSLQRDLPIDAAAPKPRK